MSVIPGRNRWAWMLAFTQTRRGCSAPHQRGRGAAYRMMCGTALAALLSPLAREARACDCDGRSVEENLAAAEMVFVGEICGEMLVERYERIIGFQVVQSWKGVEERRIVEVRTARSSAGCGPDNPEQGDLFLVYAQRNPDSGVLESSECTGTVHICTGYGLDLRDLTEYDALGFAPLIADGPTTDEVLNICDPDASARQFLGSDPCQIDLRADPSEAPGPSEPSPSTPSAPCGFGGLLPLGVGMALSFARRFRPRR